MGESSFWYRPTRVVPDQRPLNGRCCCCCWLEIVSLNLMYLGQSYLLPSYIWQIPKRGMTFSSAIYQKFAHHFTRFQLTCHIVWSLYNNGASYLYMQKTSSMLLLPYQINNFDLFWFCYDTVLVWYAVVVDIPPSLSGWIHLDMKKCNFNQSSPNLGNGTS